MPRELRTRKFKRLFSVVKPLDNLPIGEISLGNRMGIEAQKGIKLFKACVQDAQSKLKGRWPDAELAYTDPLVNDISLCKTLAHPSNSKSDTPFRLRMVVLPRLRDVNQHGSFDVIPSPLMVTVEIDAPIGWRDDGESTVAVGSLLANLSALIRDVFLDIYMANCLPAPYSISCLFAQAAQQTTSSNAVSWLYSKKVEYVREKLMKGEFSDSRHGPVHDGVKYVSLSSFCDANMDSIQNIWFDFMKWLDIERYLELPTNIAKEIERRFGAGSVPCQKIAKDIEKLAHGRYVILITDRKPKGKEEFICKMIGISESKWKKARYKIMPESHLSRPELGLIKELMILNYIAVIPFKLGD